MKALTLEVGRPPRTTTCEPCGRATLSTAGFVYANGDAYAVYLAALHEHADRPEMDLAIGLGTWQTDDAVADVSAFLRAWPAGEEIDFGFVDPDDSAWAQAKILRNQLAAASAPESSDRAELLRVAELVVDRDPAVNHHLRHVRFGLAD